MNFDKQIRLIEKTISEFTFEKRTPETFGRIRTKLRQVIPTIGIVFIRPDPSDTSKIFVDTLLCNGTKRRKYEYHGP